LDRWEGQHQATWTVQVPRFQCENYNLWQMNYLKLEKSAIAYHWLSSLGWAKNLFRYESGHVPGCQSDCGSVQGFWARIRRRMVGCKVYLYMRRLFRSHSW
jgi:hypothetical protein